MTKIIRRAAATAGAAAVLAGTALALAPAAAMASTAPPPPAGSYGKCDLTLTTTAGILGGLEGLLFGGDNNWQAYCPASS